MIIEPGKSNDREENKTEKQESGEANYEKGSKSDPQKTELEGLKQGGKEPHVHAEDKPRDSEGNIDQ